jgi:hypothetical protein
MTSTDARPGYDPNLLGGGSVVPYVTCWTGEEPRTPRVVYRPGGGIAYATETPIDRDEWGVLWTPMAARVGSGRPLFATMHPVRQRRAMLRLRCQVCARPADRTDDGHLWLLPAGHDAGWSAQRDTIHPPLCRSCAQVSVRTCPALRPGFVALRAHSRVTGVTGVQFQPGHRFPALAPRDDDEVIRYADPRARWTLATQLVRTLHDCTLTDLNTLS